MISGLEWLRFKFNFQSMGQFLIKERSFKLESVLSLIIKLGNRVGFTWRKRWAEGQAWQEVRTRAVLQTSMGHTGNVSHCCGQQLACLTGQKSRSLSSFIPKT